MTIEKFLAMENGEPGYTKTGTVTHVPFPAGGNGVQMSAGSGQQWDLPNSCIVPMTGSSTGSIEFTSTLGWSVGVMGSAGHPHSGVHFDSVTKTLAFSRSSNVASEDGKTTAIVDVGDGIHRWGVNFNLHGTTGFMNVFCDGVSVFSFNGNTQGNGATATTTGLKLAGRSGSAINANFDSVVISTDSFKGDCHVDYLVPNGNGDTSQWVGSDGNSVDNWGLVDEIPASGADYVEADEVDLRDLYTVANLPASGTILGVQAVVHPWKLGPGAEIPTSTILKTAAGEHVDLIEGISTAMQGLEAPIRTTRPGGGAWTVSDVNSMQIGVTTEEP